MYLTQMGPTTIVGRIRLYVGLTCFVGTLFCGLAPNISVDVLQVDHMGGLQYSLGKKKFAPYIFSWIHAAHRATQHCGLLVCPAHMTL